MCFKIWGQLPCVFVPSFHICFCFPCENPQSSFTLPSTTSGTPLFLSATRPSHSATLRSLLLHTTPQSPRDAPQCSSASPRTCTAAHPYWMSTTARHLTPAGRPATICVPASRAVAATPRSLTPQPTSARPASLWTLSPPCPSPAPTWMATKSSHPNTQALLMVDRSTEAPHLPIRAVREEMGASGRAPCASQGRCHSHCQRCPTCILSPLPHPHRPRSHTSPLRTRRSGPAHIPSALRGHWACPLLLCPLVS